MKVFGQLEKAQLENTTSDTSSLPKGMITYRTDSNLTKVSNGTSMIALIDESSTQTMSGKTIGGGLGFAQITTPSAPSAGNSKFYPKSDGKFYFMNSDGVEQEVGSGSGGGQGGKNYVPNKGSFNAGTVGWSAFNTTFSSDVPTTITAGSSKVAIALETVAPLSDAGSMKFSITTAAGSAGHGVITDAMTIDDADLARVFEVTADYLVKSGLANLDLSGTDTSTLEFWVYNVGLAEWTQLVNFRPFNSSIASTAKMSFQTSIEKTSNKNQYRLALIVKNDALGTADVLLDTVYFGRGSSASLAGESLCKVFQTSGQSIPDSTDTQVAWNLISYDTVGAFSSNTFTAKEAGKYLFSGIVQLDANAGTYGGYSAVAKNGVLQEYHHSPKWSTLSQPHAYVFEYELQLDAGDYVSLFLNQQSGGALSVSTGIGGGNYASFKLLSSAQSSGTAGRDIAMMALGPANSIGGSFTYMTGWFTTFIDTVGGFDATTGVYTAKEDGTYLVNGTFLVSGTYAAGNYVQVSVEFGVSQLDFQNRSGGAQSYVAVPISGVISLKAGDQVKVKIASDASALSYGGGSSFNFFGITKVSGGVAIAGATSVICQYEQASGQSIPNSTLTAIVWDTKVIDSHNAMNISNGEWTCPVSGTYQFNNANAFAANGTGFRQFTTDVNNGASSKILCQQIPNASNGFVTCGSTLHRLKAGDVVKIMAFQTSGGALSLTGSGYDTINIVRVGNY